MNSETRVWISAVLGGPLVMALTAQAQEAASSAQASTSSIVGIVAGIAGVVLVGSVLALCGSSEKAPSIRIHDPAPAPERPMQPTQPPPSNYRPAAQVRPKPMHEMSEQSVQIDMSRAQHQQGKPQYMPQSHPYPPSNGRPSAGHSYSSQGSNASGPGMQSHPGFSNQGYQQRPPQAPSGHGQPGYVPQYQHQSQYQQPHQPQYQQQPQQPNQYGYGPPSGRPSPYQSQPPPMHPQGSGSMRQSFPGPMSGSNSGSAPRPMQSGSFGSVDPNERVSMPYVDSYGRAVQAPPYSSSGRPDVYRVSDGSASPSQKRPSNPTAEGRPLAHSPYDKPWTPMQTPPGPQPGPPGHARVSSPQVPPGPPGPAGIPNPTPPPRTSPSGYAAAPARSPAPQGPPTPSGPMLAPRDGSLDALAEFLRELIEKTGGRCGNGPYTIDGEQPIRKCLYSVQCTCKTTFGKSVDALFFASKTDYDRQHNICSKRPLQEFRADVREVVEASTFRDASSGLNVAVPNFIITEATSSMDDLIANMPTVQRNSTISAIATQLTTQLVMLHSKKIVHCGVTRRNIVQLGGMNAIWTFREYCSYVGEGKEMEAARHLQEVRILPPEAAEAALRQAPMIATAAMDIWQLGVLLYELYSGSNYWDADASPESILRDLSTPGGLPHEKDPAKLNAIARSSPALQPHKGIIARMLDRNPAARPNAATLKRDLIASASDITMQGNTVTSWQAPVVNIGSSAPRA